MRTIARVLGGGPADLLGLGLVAAIVFCVVPIGYVVAALTYRNGSVVGVVLVLVMVALIAAATAPVHVLPSAALVLYAVLPQQLIGYGYFGLTPALLVILVWSVRRWVAMPVVRPEPIDRWWLGARFAAVLLVLWTVYLMRTRPPIVSGGGPSAREWVISLAVGGLLVLYVRVSAREADLLVRTLAVATIAAAVFAVVEVVIQQNPIYLPLYDAVGRGLHLDGGLHRASVGFGHPLYAGTFFAVSFAVFFVRWIDDVPRSLIPLIAAVAGAASTVSRSALAVAAVIAAVVTVVRLPQLRRTRSPKLMRLLALAPLAVVAVAMSGLIDARTSTGEAARSSEVRGDNVTEAIVLARSSGWVGSGPTTADPLTIASSGGAYPMENSLLQLLVSLGVPGLVLFLTTLALVVVSAVRSGAHAGAAAAVAFIAVTAGYNGLETLLPLHSLLGLVVLLCLAGASQSATTDVPSTPAPALTAPRTSNGPS
ncbi:O-antigen ligase family protein [Pseudonocardia nematodicida]|uniref:O-antigen ligase family protein n=1 Tax=Pseudonocardia nematodicida TaxID=1206997 RepID=A0ABV1K3L4_9PSEU